MNIQTTVPAYPTKTREMHNHHFDSTMWNGFQFRDDDVIVATYAKSGTTWTQQIVAQLIFDGDASVDVPALSPWVDLRFPPREVKMPAIEAQSHRRSLKTHLPVDALVFSPKAKYIYIGRDGRDVAWSMFNHHATANDHWYDALNGTPALSARPSDAPATTRSSIIGTGWPRTDTRSGRSGKTSAPGGPCAIFPT